MKKKITTHLWSLVVTQQQKEKVRAPDAEDHRERKNQSTPECRNGPQEQVRGRELGAGVRVRVRVRVRTRGGGYTAVLV